MINRPAFRFHPQPLMVLAATVLCLVASLAFGQVRSVAPASRAAPTGISGTPSASGLTSGAATGLSNGMPSASGLTSGSGTATLPPGSPSTSGLNSGSTGAPVTGNRVPTGSAVGPTVDATATTTGGSTRGIVVPDAPAGAVTTTQQGLPTSAGVADPTRTMGAAGVGGPGSGGASNGVPSVDPGPGRMAQAGPTTALQIAQMFGQADSNADGQLSRAEALRLPFVTMTFEDMDTNRDGSVSRSEYENSLR